MEEAPDHGSHVVKELKRGFGASGVDCACCDEKPKVGVDFIRGTEGDAVVMRSISASASSALGEIGGDR